MITLFLDIDGVIATSAEWGRKSSSKTYLKEFNVYPFNPTCVKILNSILDQFDIEIVLHSDWKFHYDLTQLDQIFKHNGVVQSPIATTKIDYMIQNTPQARMDHIKEYILTHNIETYIIIDDLNLKQKFWGNKFIRTPRDSEGIKQSGIKEKIVNRLNKFHI